MALVAEMQWDGRLCVFYNPHLESQTNDRGRARQIREMLDDIQAPYPPETSVVIALPDAPGITVTSPESAATRETQAGQ